MYSRRHRHRRQRQYWHVGVSFRSTVHSDSDCILRHTIDPIRARKLIPAAAHFIPAICWNSNSIKSLIWLHAFCHSNALPRQSFCHPNRQLCYRTNEFSVYYSSSGGFVCSSCVSLMDEFCHVSPILIHDSRGRTTNAKFTNYINVHERINENTHSNYHQQTQHNQPRPFAFDVLPVDRRCQSSSSSVVPSTFHSASNSSISAIIITE